MAVTKITDLSSLFSLIYEDALFVMRDNNLMTQLVTIMNGRGYADRKIGIWNTGEILEVGDGVDFTTNRKFSESLKATFSPTEKMGQFIVTDGMVETAEDRTSTRTLAARELGMAGAQKVDVDLLAVFDDFANNKGSANNAMTLGLLSAAHTAIRRDNARGTAYGVLEAAHWHDIWGGLANPAATYTFQGDVANQALRDFYRGEPLAGLRLFVTNNIEIDADDDALSGVFTQDALGLDVRKAANFEEERDASLRGWEINFHMGYAVGTIRDEHGCKIIADATEPAS